MLFVILEDTFYFHTLLIVIQFLNKCHHNDAVGYIQNNGLFDFKDKLNDDVLDIIWKHYNLAYIQDKIDDMFLLKLKCKYSYNFMIMNILQDKVFDVNQNIIFKCAYLFI